MAMSGLMFLIQFLAFLFESNGKYNLVQFEGNLAFLYPDGEKKLIVCNGGVTGRILEIICAVQVAFTGYRLWRYIYFHNIEFIDNKLRLKL